MKQRGFSERQNENEKSNRRIGKRGRHRTNWEKYKYQKKTKTDFTFEIENPRKIQDITVQTMVHVTTDMKIMKQIADTEMTPI